MPTVERIDLAVELRRIAREMDEAGRPGREYCLSKYDSDLLRDAAKMLEILRAAPAAPA